MSTIDCGHWNGRRNRLPHLAGSIVWRSRWGRRFRLPVEADFHRSSKSRKRLYTLNLRGCLDVALLRNPDTEHGEELFEVDRLGDVIGCAGLHTLPPVSLHGFGGEGDNRKRAEIGYLADRKHGFVTIHIGHHDVHQNKVNAANPLQNLDARASVLGM